MTGTSACNWPYPRFIAHRGAGRLAAENTMAAFRLGWECGYRMFEFDVRLAADGRVVLMHDDTLDRTTDGTGPVHARSWEELQQLDAGSWHSPQLAGERIPDLEQLARWLLGRGGLANVEIKAAPGQDAASGSAAAKVAARCWAAAPVPPLLSSFSVRALQAARDVAPELPRGLLLEQPPADVIERALGLGCVALHLEWHSVEADLLQAAHQVGLRVLCYTVNEKTEVARLRSMGVDGLITDSVDTIAAID